MNHVLFKGNLVNDTKIMQNQNGGISAFNKIGVYNGKDKNEQPRPSMFFDIVVFGKSAEQLRDMGVKGAPVIVSGRLEEEASTSQTTGQTYMNKRIVCDNVSVCVKPIQQAPVQPVQAQPQYAQPVYQQPQYQAPVQQPVSPW